MWDGKVCKSKSVNVQRLVRLNSDKSHYIFAKYHRNKFLNSACFLKDYAIGPP